ncbi:hypothetical protein NV379_01910 [Paenibacillus sp. N1-5-1-14]|uniref:hypothetical protein n=1 Tax=Paenibacillus radicibacter TaxID=2972488 RepID=UPI002158B873|nr:hypothetical protein [Paenibacillus radicibacter]MCR8641400.1 hypothetical protein [Paenibacillus radicibacter]
MEVNADLYDFLKENETGLYTKEFNRNKTVYAYVHVYFNSLSEFAEIVGSHPFDEGGMQVTMFESTIAIELNDIIDGDGHYLSSYKKCFNEYDWEQYEKQIEEMER